MAEDVVSQLGGFALDDVLRSLELDQDAIAAAKRGLGISSASFSHAEIFSGKFVDDGPGDEREDYEAMVDREMHRERAGAHPGASSSGMLLRGEEVDSDEPHDEEIERSVTPMDEIGPLKVTKRKDRSLHPNVDRIPSAPRSQQSIIKKFFPDFERGKIINMTDVFCARPRKRRRTTLAGVKFDLTRGSLPRSRSTRDALVAPPPPAQRNPKISTLAMELGVKVHEPWEDEGSSDEELVKAIEKTNQVTESQWKMPKSSTDFSLMELDDWESKIIWGPESPQASNKLTLNRCASRNPEFDRGDWVKSIIWDQGQSYRDCTALYLSPIDPDLRHYLIYVAPPSSDSLPVAQAAGLDKFNLSGDERKEMARKSVRQTFTQLVVVHAYPAQKLQLPFYKLRLTKEEARSFHRSALKFPRDLEVKFIHVRSSKKADRAGRQITPGDREGLLTTSDITCGDSSPFVLWEYSEENPPILSNFGMGSVLVNYYRKKSTADTYIPHDIGEPIRLEPRDGAPFFGLGFVDPGQTVPTLYNNLVRAPLFKHKAAATDFLVVRSTILGETKYFLRDIKHAFVVGQTYPAQEVPGPSSRIVHSLAKERLQTIAARLAANSPHQRIKLQRLIKYYPDQSEMQMRQRIKPFMETTRTGPNQGFWTMKSSTSTIKTSENSEEPSRATPEIFCLAESTQVGARHLEDAGFAQAEPDDADDDDSKLSLQQKLAPWITTKNFVRASKGNARLKLHGEGDPTGRGEGFSFLPANMKTHFLRKGENFASRQVAATGKKSGGLSYNNQEQAQIYQEEIRRIWEAQHESLSNPVAPELTEADEARHRFTTPGSSSQVGTPSPFGREWTPGSFANSPAYTGYGSGQDGKKRVLRIRRLISGRWETEIVQDSNVFTSYLRQRQKMDDGKLDVDNLPLTNDSAENERLEKKLREQLAKDKHNQSRRLARKNQASGVAIGAVGVDGKTVRAATTRVCGACGQPGHIRSSRKLCPRWHELNTGTTSSSPNRQLSFGGGLAMP